MKDESFEKLLDFLQGNKENASIICSFIDDLTSEGFEHYISEYYKKIQPNRKKNIQKVIHTVIPQ
ncbi:MAG: hypothetical protein WC774_01110 [Candidatus Gracilibacteria bacterium]